MEELILYGIILVVGMFAGWKAHEYFMIGVIKMHPEIIEEACRVAREGKDTQEVTIETDDGKSITTTGVELFIEKVNGHLYAYSKTSNQFIAQGDTLDALLESAHTRFPGKTFFGTIPE
jgi:hypothetical protein